MVGCLIGTGDRGCFSIVCLWEHNNQQVWNMFVGTKRLLGSGEARWIWNVLNRAFWNDMKKLTFTVSQLREPFVAWCAGKLSRRDCKFDDGPVSHTTTTFRHLDIMNSSDSKPPASLFPPASIISCQRSLIRSATFLGGKPWEFLYQPTLSCTSLSTERISKIHSHCPSSP